VHSYPFPAAKRHCLRYRVMSLFRTDLLCVSDKVKVHLLSKTGISTRKTHMVHTGIDLQRFDMQRSLQDREDLRRRLSIDSRSKIVGNVSRLADGKGHSDLLTAAADILVRHPDTVFLIVGDGGRRNELMGLSRSLNIAEHVRFTGSRRDIPELLDIMDIFVFPAGDEAFGISVLEAMAMGKPIIATNDAAVPELIEDRKEGLLVEPNSPGLISAAVQVLLADPERCARMGAAARARSRLFSLERMTAAVEDIYLKIVSRGDALPVRT
ncbi:MAG: glycosyltransferase, partial [Thermodesulfobacteriota bacterium]